MARRFAICLGLLLASGCTLIDQRTFDPEAGKRPVTPPAPVVAGPAPEYGRAPLFVVQVPTAGDLRAAVAKPVAAARGRKAEVVFDVVEITPEAGGAVGAAAEAVGQAIVAQGVRPDRVRLAVRPDAAARREVRVYIR